MRAQPAPSWRPPTFKRTARAFVRCNGGFGSPLRRCYRDRVTSEALDQLASEFLSSSLPRDQWNHIAHLSVGAWHVYRFGVDEAVARLRVGIRALNDRHGTPNTTTSGYHETITVAYARLIEEFLSSFEPSIPLEHRVSHLLSGPLSERSCLLRFWSRALLMSEAARAAWVAPDLEPLGVPPEAIPLHRQ